MNPGSSLEQFLKKEVAVRRVTHEIAATIECLVFPGIELAGGKSTDGFDCILDKSVSGIHCRIPLIFGSSDSVDLVQEYFSVAPANKLCSPLFSNRNLFRY